MKEAITQKVCYTGWHGSKTIEELKPEYFVDSGSLAASQSELAKREKNDCVVRAFMSALDLPYERAHGFVKKNFLIVSLVKVPTRLPCTLSYAQW